MKAAAFFLLASLSACGLPTSAPRQPVLISAGGVNHFPFAYDLPGAKVLVAYSTHKDEVIAAPVDAARVIGADRAVSAANFYLSGLASTSAGGLYAASYITTATDAHSEIVHGWTSADNSASWQPRRGVLHLPEPPISRTAGWGGLLFHRRLHQIGSKLAGTVYGGYARDRRSDGGEWYRSAWVESDDDGVTWRVLSTIAEGPAGTEGYAEPVSAICPDGRILAVLRTGPTSPMRWSRSADGGATWSAPRELPGMTGWDPDLLALPGGPVLSWGITGFVHVARSEDCGDTWQRVADFDIPTCSGYSGLALVNGGLTVFTDRNNETEVWGYPVMGN